MASGAPRLVVVYGHRSHDVLTLWAGAKGWCDVIWLIDRDDPSAAGVRPLLERFGTVVDRLAAPPDEVAAALAPLHPDGLATFYDTGMESIAEVAARLGLRFHAPAAGLALEDKHHQREAFRTAGLPTPRTAVLAAGAGGEEAARAGAAVGFPLVLKPRRASGSWHTFPVLSADGLDELWADLEREPPEERILEEYLSDGPPMPGGFEADYVSVETIAVDGQLHHLAVTGRFPVLAPFRETGFFIPSTLGSVAQHDVLALAGEALRAVGFAYGCAHTEIKLTAEGPRVIEINGRIGGGVPEMLRLATGLDVVRLTMQAALGIAPDISELPAASQIGYRFFHQPPDSARRVLEVEGLDELKRHPGVESVRLHRPPGTPIDPREGTRSYIFVVVGAAEDRDGLLGARRYLDEEIRIAYESADDSS